MMPKQRYGSVAGACSPLRERPNPLNAEEILQEARKLREVSNDLNRLAEKNEPLAEALSIMSGSVCRAAIMLEVLVAVKLGPPRTRNPQLMD
jgi:hypothetical protein